MSADSALLMLWFGPAVSSSLVDFLLLVLGIPLTGSLMMLLVMLRLLLLFGNKKKMLGVTFTKRLKR